ncbi:MAG: histidine kinase [Synechococcus sp. CPC35]|nr:histidine kinase [Synechococcus sp. CPC35]
MSSTHAALETLPKAIQLSVSPVFLLTGIGAMMNVLSGRLSRGVDRARALQERQEQLSELEQHEFRLTRRRLRLVIRSIELLSLSVLLISCVVAVMFLTVALEINLSAVVAPLFVAAMLMVTAASFCFLREIKLASQQIQARFEV